MNSKVTLRRLEEVKKSYKSFSYSSIKFYITYHTCIHGRKEKPLPVGVFLVNFGVSILNSR